MSVLATLILTLAGLALIAVALSDIFRTILHVEARGALGRELFCVAGLSTRDETPASTCKNGWRAYLK